MRLAAAQEQTLSNKKSPTTRSFVYKHKGDTKGSGLGAAPAILIRLRSQEVQLNYKEKSSHYSAQRT